MITPSHIIYSWTLAKKTQKKSGEDENNSQKSTKNRTLAFALGALFPDTLTHSFWLCPIINTLYGT